MEDDSMMNRLQADLEARAMMHQHGLEPLSISNPINLKGDKNQEAMCEGQSTVASKELITHPDDSHGNPTPPKKRGRPAKKKIGLSQGAVLHSNPIADEIPPPEKLSQDCIKGNKQMR